MPTTTRIFRNKFSSLERQLASQRQELQQRIDQHTVEVVMDRELDDEVAAAVENANRDMLSATLERERRTLVEIDSALIRMKKGEYGICDVCGETIAKARLDALPWARRCIRCAERVLSSHTLLRAS
jgi:DnaK suppressor protein